MSINQLNIIYFSPTGTTQKVLEEMARSFSVLDTNTYDLTLHNKKNKQSKITSESLTIIGMPVYSGRIPAIAKKRLKKFNAQNAPVVLIAVYGNRHYDDALVEMEDWAKEAGFTTIAAAAFIGEHSFSTVEKPIAANRPDHKDTEQAHQFGEAVKEKISSGNLSTPQIPGNRPYKPLGRLPQLVPESLDEKCNKCGECIEACPTQAITLVNDKFVTDKEACIWCCACVKACPLEARIFKNEKMTQMQDKLFTFFSERREPEIFL